jgi:hypothetical protein
MASPFSLALLTAPVRASGLYFLVSSGPLIAAAFEASPRPSPVSTCGRLGAR